MEIHLEEIAKAEICFATVAEYRFEQENLLQDAAADGHAPAMYQIGLKSADLHEKRHWFREAARKGYAPAMYAYGLSCGNPNIRKNWLQKAAFEGHQGAIHVLANECHDPTEKRRWLRLANAEYLPADFCDHVIMCGKIEDRERQLAEADRDGWQPAMNERCCDSAC